ncbi:PrsW family glutamic-type intramembrane protease [Actinorugispora endophytica]|uniref:RsiW-degrading membrane proteinase PrsW (M82 family) n=1 Tax=Actinorugispora endophytica TaxID=1605990 RepID=A0A4R6UVQ7_9ACTN|nr:PrsW family glutamic-type intramembrane protease [Actinorugispora endophytica]TDQ51430.1 RsiW-degrading membrane proteinase PrsW (M82 family) [Actinorugispora endophytica]
MDEQAMLTRDLVLRICATATELDQGWTRIDRKVVAPFTASRDTSLIERIAAAARAMGVEHLLICRTRSEYAYEPVTQVRAAVPSLVGVIRGWGNEPTDFLVCLEDFSAAVLVTSGDLTVAAGPADYVRALVGPDIGQGRADFAETARLQRDPDLLRAAGRYGCLEQGGRHARGGRGPGPDLAERVTARIESVREGRPGTAALLRALRGAWGWAAVAVLALALLFVPGASGVLPAALVTVWLLVQLAWLARSRTVSFAALLRLAAIGALMTWPVALLELAVAATAGLDPANRYAYAYLAVPVEEAAKFAPVLLFWLVARRRFKRFAAVDYLLVAAAAGAGFQLAETVARTLLAGGVPDLLLPQGGLFTLLPGWVDLPGAGIRFSGHAVTTGLVGAAFGLAVVGRRLYGAWLLLLPPLALGAAALEHLNYNAVLAGLDTTAVTSVVFGLYGNGAATRWLLLLMLLFAVVLDYRLARFAAETTPPLPGAAPLRSLTARAHGRAVWRRSHLAGDIAPAFRRMALAGARLPVTLVEAASSILHEFAVVLTAASRGPVALCAAWRFLLRRREHAMGSARAAGRPWRRVPTREDLAAAERRLSLGLGLPAALAAAGVLLAAAPAGAAAADPAAAYAVMTTRALADWFGALTAADGRWALAGGLALVSLLMSGWTVPRAHPSLRDFLRAPRANAGGFLGALAPGQVPYAVAGLLGLLLPGTTDRLLR